MHNDGASVAKQIACIFPRQPVSFVRSSLRDRVAQIELFSQRTVSYFPFLDTYLDFLDLLGRLN